MDLPSISRVTKLPLDQLKQMAKSTPIFAPGLDSLFATGAVTEKWNATNGLSKLLTDLLKRMSGFSDQRDQLGLERGGRRLASAVAARVKDEAAKHV
jgi:malonate decarboxylase gamma subunit